MILKHLESNNKQFSAHLGQLFWDSKAAEVVSFFNQATAAMQGTRWWATADVFSAYHSALVTGNDGSEFLTLLDKPLESWELDLVVPYQLKSEPTSALGLLSQPTAAHKGLLAAFIGRTNGCEHFIETGTCTGMTCYMLQHCFKSLVTIEAMEALHTSAKSLYHATSANNVRALLGNSAEHLENLVIEAPGEKCCFFLDAHYSYGPTSNHYGICPLIRELNAIFTRFLGATIVIDDMRLMNGQGEYPTFNEILNCVPQTYVAAIKFDQMILSHNPLLERTSVALKL